MRVGAYLEIVLVAILSVATLLGIGYGIVWKTTKNNAGVRRKEFETMRKERDAAIETVDKIEDITMQDVSTMLETPLNSDIRKILREYKAVRRSLE